MSSSVNPLQAAKDTLKSAENFGHRDTGNKKVGEPTPPHKASEAPISYRAASHPDSGPSVADELKVKSDNVSQYANADKKVSPL